MIAYYRKDFLQSGTVLIYVDTQQILHTLLAKRAYVVINFQANVIFIDVILAGAPVYTIQIFQDAHLAIFRSLAEYCTIYFCKAIPSVDSKVHLKSISFLTPTFNVHSDFMTGR